MKTTLETVPPVCSPAVPDVLALDFTAGFSSLRWSNDIDILSVAIWLQRGAPPGGLDGIREEVALQLSLTVAARLRDHEARTFAEAPRSAERPARGGRRRGGHSGEGNARYGGRSTHGLHDDAAD